MSCNKLRSRSNETRLNINVEADKVILDDDLNLDYMNSEVLTPEQKEEENRLRYVSFSRAKKVLIGMPNI